MLSQTTTSGGDMGAHHYPAWYMHTYLLPHFKLTGWTMQWYAGMPMFTFYLPLPFAMIGLLAFFIPYTVAFKLVTILGVFALPVVAFAYGRLLRLPRLVRPHRGRRRPGLPGDGELLDLRRQHPEHAGGRVRLLDQLRADVPLPRHALPGDAPGDLRLAVRAERADPDVRRADPHRDGHRAGAGRAQPADLAAAVEGADLRGRRVRARLPADRVLGPALRRQAAVERRHGVGPAAHVQGPPAPRSAPGRRGRPCWAWPTRSASATSRCSRSCG